MKKYITMLLLFGWIGIVWAQDTIPAAKATAENAKILSELEKIKIQLADIVKLQHGDPKQSIGLLRANVHIVFDIGIVFRTCGRHPARKAVHKT